MGESFANYLSKYGLIFSWTVAPVMTIDELLTSVATDMEQSSFAYCFGDLASGSHIARHERHALQLLALRNKGTARHDQIHLKIVPSSPNMTIEEMIHNRNQYAHPQHCLYEHTFQNLPTRYEFVIHLSEWQSLLNHRET